MQWGIPRDRIRFEEYGRLHLAAAEERCGSEKRARLAFFGQLTPYKGVTVLLADQNLMFARAVADRALVMERGRLVHAASRAELQGNDPALHRFLAV